MIVSLAKYFTWQAGRAAITVLYTARQIVIVCYRELRRTFAWRLIEPLKMDALPEGTYELDCQERALLESYIDATMPPYQESRERETTLLPMSTRRELRCEAVN